MKAELKDLGEGLPLRWAVFINGKFVANFLRHGAAESYVRHINRVMK